MALKATHIQRFLPAWACLLALVLASNAQASSAGKRKPTPAPGSTFAVDMDPSSRCPAGQDENSRCIPQGEAFSRAAQASSYLGLYLVTSSGYVAGWMNNPENQQKAAARIEACLQNSPECDAEAKNQLMMALIQYNLVNEVKANMLQNNTLRERMKSLPKDPELKNGIFFEPKDGKTRSSGHAHTNTFKLTKKDLAEGVTFRSDEQLLKERQQLGPAFMKEYENFLDTYTQTTAGKEKWYYEYTAANNEGGAALNSQGEAKKSKAQYVWRIDPSTGRPMMNRDLFYQQTQIEKQKPIQEAIKQYKEHVSSTELISEISGEKTEAEDTKDASKKDPNLKTRNVAVNTDAFRKAGLGLPGGIAPKEGEEVPEGVDLQDPSVIAGAIVGNLNETISKEERKLASTKGKDKVVPDVQLSVKAFDDFLQKVWPPSRAKSAIGSENK